MTRYHPDPLIDAAIRETHVTHPYYATAIARLRIVKDANVPTMATSTEWVTHYNPDFVRTLTAEQAGAVLVHELEHLLRRHHDRCGSRDPRRFNVAGDAEINQHLDGLPDDAVYPETLGLPRGHTAEVYYGATGDGAQPQPQNGDGAGDGGQSAGAGGAGQPGDGPDCGSAAGGDTRPWESGDEQRPGSGAANGGDDARRETAQQVMAHTGYGAGRGDGPGDDIREWAESELGIDRAAWYRALATVIGRSMAQVGAPQRWQWPGRRDVRDMGGAMVPRWTGLRPSAAIVIDTSGSITPLDLEMAVAAAHYIKRLADVRVYGCDTRVVDYGSAVPDGLRGGGGTDMRVGIDHAIRDGATAVVVITDCDTPWPAVQPNVPVIIGANVQGSLYVKGGYTPQWATAIPIVAED